MPLTKLQKKTLEGGYLLPDETFEQAIRRVSKAYADSDAHAARLEEYILKNWMMPATPVFSNAGNKKGLPISCYLSSVEDSIDGLVDSWVENVYLTVGGGGIGNYFGNVRSIGAKTSRGGESLGIIGFLKTVEAQMLGYNQGGSRRGAAAIYLDISHPEIEEFITMRKPGGDPSRKCLSKAVFHHAVNIPDAFMHAVEKDEKWDLIDPNSKVVTKTVKARELWALLLETRVETGEPYIHFIDTSNRDYRARHKNSKLKIQQSNLCVHGETLLLTSSGFERISELEDTSAFVWNGKEFSKVLIKKTGQDQKLKRVEFSDGSAIECTDYHKFYVQRNYNKNSVEIVSTNDLKIGDKLEKWDLPVMGEYSIDTNIPMYSCGFYSAEGNTDSTKSWIYEPKYVCKPKLVGEFRSDPYNREVWKHPRWSKTFVPFQPTYSIKDRVEWLSGYLDGDGCIIESDRSQGIQVASIDREFLFDVKLLLISLGIHSKICDIRNAGVFSLPDGRGGLKDYHCQQVWRLLINSTGTKKLLELGLDCLRLDFNEVQDADRDASRFVKVVAICNVDGVHDTFCFTEPKRQRGWFNGVVTGNCNEIYLPTNSERTAVCCLSSVNLETYDEWKDDELFIEDTVRMLDNVLTVFMDKTKGKPAFEKARNSVEKARDIGLGAMGFHSYLQKKGIPFESALAYSINKGIFENLWKKADLASGKLAAERGEPFDMHDMGRRNSHIMAIAPNASISLLADCSPGIEPYSTNYFVQKTKQGSFVQKNKHLKALLIELGKDNDRVWKSIRDNEGSVQHLDFLSDDQKDIFKTAFEIDQKWVIEHAAERQKSIDQGQSVNLFLLPGIHKKRLHDLHWAAWEKGLKGLYYCRSDTARKAENLSTQVERYDMIETENEEGCVACGS